MQIIYHFDSMTWFDVMAMREYTSTRVVLAP